MWLGWTVLESSENGKETEIYGIVQSLVRLSIGLMVVWAYFLVRLTYDNVKYT